MSCTHPWFHDHGLEKAANTWLSVGPGVPLASLGCLVKWLFFLALTLLSVSGIYS